MHVGSCLVFEGEPPALQGVRRAASSAGCTSCRATGRGSRSRRSARAGRCGSTTRTSTGYHVRHTALPAPAARTSCKRSPAACSPSGSTARSRCGSCGSSRASAGDRFAIISKTHHCLVDGISGVDIADGAVRPRARPAAARRRRAVGAAPRAGAPQLLGATPASSSRASPAELARAAARARASAAPRRRRGRGGSRGLGALALAGSTARRRRPLNVRIGPHRRFAWVDGDLARFKAIKDALGGTVNDVVLAAVAGALRHAICARHGDATDGARAARRWSRVRARGRRARRARQPGRRGVRAAARRPRDPVARLRARARGDGRPEGVRAGGRAPSSRGAGGLRRRRRSSPGGAPPGRASASSTSSSPTCPGRSSRSTCSAAGCASSTRSSRSPRTPRSGSR